MLHPYYKLAYIEENWVGVEEYQAECAAGIPDARNWQEYARQVVDEAVSSYTYIFSLYGILMHLSDIDGGILA